MGKKMRKVFLPLSAINLLSFSLSVLLFFSMLYGLTIVPIYYLLVDRQYGLIFIIFIGLYGDFLWLWGIVHAIHNRIIFDERGITVTGDYRPKKHGIQFPLAVNYNDIQGVALVYSNLNSEKRRLKGSIYGSGPPLTYYELTLANGKTKWIHLNRFSKKQRKQMLEIINQKSNLNISWEDLEIKKRQ